MIDKQIIKSKERSFKVGMDAESSFVDAALSCGYRVIKGSNEDDISHTDFIIKSKGREWRVDVKSHHSVRGDESLVWVELKNVIGNAGWLFGSADIIAFETRDSFMLIERAKLAELVRRNVIKREMGESVKPWFTHSRKNRNDLLTIVPRHEIKRFMVCEFKKGE